MVERSIIGTASAVFPLALAVPVAGADQQGNSGGQDQDQGQGQDQPQGRLPRPQRQPTAPQATRQGGPSAPQGQAAGQPSRQGKYQAGPSQSPRRAFVQSPRRNIQVHQRYRAGSYQAPQDSARHRWSYGQRLPRVHHAHNC
jgi:hypothetical protein